MRIERVVVVFVAAIFCLSVPSAFAATRSWFVTKDKRGICKVVKAKAKTPASIAGPFATKKEALESKKKECGSAMPSRTSPKQPAQPEPSSQTGDTGTRPVGPNQPGQ